MFQNKIPYSFSYGIKDEYAGTDFGQSEDSDGQVVKGTYTIALPDGRIQTVSFSHHLNYIQKFN